MKTFQSDLLNMLNSLPPGKIKIIPENPEDEEVARQLTSLLNYNLQNPVDDSVKE